MSCFAGIINYLFGKPPANKILGVLVTFDKTDDKIKFDNCVRGDAYVYTLALPSGKYYVGYTKDLKNTLYDKFADNKITPLYISNLTRDATLDTFNTETVTMRKIYGPDNINS